MKKNSDRRFGLLSSAVLCFLLVISISNCKEKIEGCLDIEAENFAFSADEACPDDCCTYPSLTFEIAFRWRSEPLVYGAPLLISFDNVINITKTKLYISEISLTNDSESFKIMDRIELNVNDGSGTATFVDDFALISRDFTSFNYEIGEIRGVGTFDTLRFVVGLNEQANTVEPSLVPEGHSLALETDTMWSVENAYVFNKLIMAPEFLNPTVNREFEITGDTNKVEITLPFQLDLEVGNNITVPIIIDYYEWFRGIDFGVDSTVIVNKIVENTAEAFSINE